MKICFVVGIFLAALVAMIDPYIMLKGLSGGVFCWEYWAPAAIFILFLMAILSCTPRFNLKKNELLLIYIMTSTASVLPSMGFMSSFMSIMSGLKYFATSVNKWQELIISKTRPLMMVQDEQAIRYFYEGLPHGEPIPYSAWLKPMGFMFVFVLVFSFLSICLMVLFRKQWIEKERLIYPLTILPLEMVKKEKNSSVPTLFKNNLFWFAFSIILLFYFSNWLSRMLTGVPVLKLSGNIILFRKNTSLRLNPYFPFLGLAYLAPRSVSLSLWFFHILFNLQTGFLRMSGFKLPGAGGSVATFETGGAMIVLVFALFFRARKHLSDCFKKAFNTNYGIDDSNEILSYRTAVIGAIVSFLSMTCFLRYFGTPWLASFAFMFFAIIVFIGLTRIVCQAGLPAATALCSPSVYVSYLLPHGIVTDQGYIVLGLQNSWASDIRTSVMATTSHSLKIQEETRIPPKLLFVAIMSSIIVSYISSAWIHIYGAYSVGALNASTTGASGGGGPWFFGGQLTNSLTNFSISKLSSPITRDIIISRNIFTVLGAIFMLGLMFLHSKLLWWPIHYIGLPVAGSHPMNNWWFAIFLAWLIKGLILRFGGHNVYKKSVPFFLGMILSHITWMVIENIINLLMRVQQ